MNLSDGRVIKMHAGNLVATLNRQRSTASSFQILGYVVAEERDVPRQT